MHWSRLRSGFRELARRLRQIRGRRGGPNPVAARPPESDEHFLRELADSIDQALLLWDLRAARLLYVSPALERLIGIPADGAALTSRLLDLVHGEDRVRVSDELRVVRDDETFETELRIRRPNGTIRWIRVRGFPVRDASGTVYRRAVLARDITSDREAREQFTAERAVETSRLLEEARRNEARFNEAQHIARVGNWELDLVTNRLLWSDEIFRIFEIDPYGFGASYEAFLETIHPDDRDTVNRAYTESVRNRTPYEIVHRLRMRDGRVKHVRERCETFYTTDGQPLRSAGTVQDITAQVQAQQERDRAQALLTTIMDSSPDWIYVKDREHRFLMVNRSCAAVVGRSPEELIGRRDTDFWSRELCEGDPQRGIRGFHDDDRQAFAGKLVHNPDVPALMQDGEARVFDTYKCPLRDSSGEIYGVLGYSRDVTERRRAERTLRSSTVTLEQHVAARTAELEAARNFTETLLDIVGALVVVLDRDGRIVRFNRACEAVTGYTAADALGRCVWDFLLLPVDRGLVKGVFGTLRAGQFPKTYENVWVTKDGRSRHIAWSNTVMTDAAGDVEYVVGTGIDITERKAAEDAMRANEELFRQLAENVQETFFVRDLGSNRIVYVSPAYETMWGRPRGALYDDPADFLKSVHPDDQARVNAARDGQYAGQGYFNQEYRVIHADGSVRWVWARTFPIRDAHGQVYRVAGLVQDLTERKRAEADLRASEELFRQLAENIQENLFVRDIASDRVVYVSPAYDRIFGRPRSALQANAYDFLDAVHPEDRTAVQQAMAQQKAGQGYFNLEYRVLRPDGDVRWVWSRTFPIRDAGGQVFRVAGLIQDLTERKRAEQALAESEAMLREVAENISEVFWLVSPDRRTMHYVSPAFRQVWGRPCSDLYANPKIVFDMIHPDDRERIMTETLPQLRGEFRDAYDQEYRIIRPDGQIRWLHVRYHPIRDAGGTVRRIAGVGEDVTERKLSEEARLQQAREQRDTLVREVHHRIKNNLQGVVGLLRHHAGEHPHTALPLEMAIARIQSMALVFGLRSHASTERVLLCRMTEAIARSIADLTGAVIDPLIERHGPCPVPVAENETVPVALILNELVFNAVKHQTHRAGRPRVTIDIHFTEQCAAVTIVTPGSHLPQGFDFAAGRGLGSGLQLVRSLLPRPAADLVLRDSDTGVVAELTLRPPVILGLTEAMELSTNAQPAADITG